MYKQNTLDLNAICNKQGKTISTKEALQDVIPIEWDKEVLQEKMKIVVEQNKAYHG